MRQVNDVQTIQSLGRCPRSQPFLHGEAGSSYGLTCCVSIGFSSAGNVGLMANPAHFHVKSPAILMIKWWWSISNYGSIVVKPGDIEPIGKPMESV